MKSVCLVATFAICLSGAAATSCIIRGSTERLCTSSSYDQTSAVEFFASAHGWGPFEDLPELESRTTSLESATLKKFRSDLPSGYTIVIR